MASTSISEQVIDCLERNKSFVVDAGAGSGKTYTLVEALTFLLKKRSKDYLSRGQQIVCITYTNVAVDEIKSRINSDPLESTFGYDVRRVSRNYQLGVPFFRLYVFGDTANGY